MNETRKQKIAAIGRRRQPGIIVVLEDIHDPHNSAAILRTCDGLGIQNVWFIFEKEKPYNPRTIGKASSSSANKWLDFTVHSSTSSCIEKLRHDGYTVITTALTDAAIPLTKAVFPEKNIAIIVGNEHRGVSETAIRLADKIIMIPMTGFVQSLNVSVATAIILWEIVRKRTTPQSISEQKQLLRTLLKRAG